VEGLDVLGDAADGDGAAEDLANRDVEELDRAELETYVSQLERRNEILADEVTELRSVLEQIDADQRPAPDHAPESGSGAADRAPAPASARQPAVDGQPARTSAGGRARAAEPSSGRAPHETIPARTGDDPPPSKPQAPPRPPNRSGVAGTIVEFVEMLGYFKRVLGYKIRLAMYSGNDRTQ
jgi:hypothetical protein